MATTAEAIQSVLIHHCQLHPLNRKRLGDMKEFTDDVKQNGIEVPLIGRIIPENYDKASPLPPQGDPIQILAGARRWTAARELNLLTIPVIIRELDDEAAYRFLMRENLHREDVHALDESDYFAHLMKQTDGWISVEGIAAEIGKSDSYVHKRLVLQDLVDDARIMFLNGDFGAAIAMEIARLPEAGQTSIIEQNKQHLRSRGAGTLTAALVREWIKREQLLELKGCAFPQADELLVKGVGACGDCEKRTGAVPSLFGDLTDSDSCTDRECFKRKAEAFLAEQLAKLQVQNAEWEPITSSYHDSRNKFEGKTVLQRWQWEKCKSGAEGAFQGLTVGEDLHPMGRICWAKIPAHCHSTADTPQAKAAKAREARQQRIKSHHRRLVFKAIRELPVKRSELDLRAITLAYFSRHDSDTRKTVCSAWGWEPLKQKEYNGWDYTRTCAERLKVMTDAEVHQLLHCLTVAQDVSRSYFYAGSQDTLMDHAKVLKIPVKKLLTAAEGRYPPKKTPKKKPKKGKKTTK